MTSSISRDEVLRGIKMLVQNVVPKSTSIEQVQSYVNSFFPYIQGFLLGPKSDHRYPLDRVIDTSDPNDTRKAHIWTHKGPDGVHFIYIPDPGKRSSREDELAETVATEVFVSTENVFNVYKTRVLTYKEEKKTELWAELNTRRALLKMPSGENLFKPWKCSNM